MMTGLFIVDDRMLILCAEHGFQHVLDTRAAVSNQGMKVSSKKAQTS